MRTSHLPRLGVLGLLTAVSVLCACGDEARGPGSGPEDAPATMRVRRDADRVLGTLASEQAAIYAAPGTPVWFLMSLEHRGMASLPIAAPTGREPAADLTLIVDAYRSHTGPVAIEVMWAGQALGTLRSDPEARGPHVPLRITIPAAWVPAGPAHLDLKNVSPALPRRSRTDVSRGRGRLWIDAIELSVAGAVAQPAGAPEDDAVTLQAPLPTDLVHVILSVPALLGEAERLATHRSSQGLRSAVVDISRIMPVQGPLAPRHLKGVIRRLAAGGTLRYVLLAGDASYDRTDLIDLPTIPTPMARTMYNGPTAADALYLPSGQPISIGRLPYRRAAEMRAYVDRILQYEQQPAPDATRRLMRFVTNEGRFGAMIDNAIERLFRGVLAERVPLAYEIEVTFASASSPFLWPPRRMNDKVIASLNEGSLFFTYVGHGFQFGFDQVRVGQQVFPVLHAKHAPQIDIQGNPPVAFIIACTTAQFDDPRHDGIGEALMKRPRGPIAYWGATRICHPIANSLVGYTLADRMAAPGASGRLGDLIRTAWDAAAATKPKDVRLGQIRFFAALMSGGVSLSNLVREGRHMYALLGDPALKIAYPKAGIELEQVPQADGAIVVTIRAPFPDGTKLHISLEKTRDATVNTPIALDDVLAESAEAVVRENHRRSNDWAIARRTTRLMDGRATIRFRIDGSREQLLTKVWLLTDDDVHQAAIPVR